MKSKDQSVHVVSDARVDRSTPKNEVKRKRFVERIAELLQSVSELDSGKDINDVINLEPQESHGFNCNSATANIERVKSDISESGSPNGDTKYAHNDVSHNKSGTDSEILCSKCNVDVADEIKPPNREDAFCACNKGIGCGLNDELSLIHI